MDTSFPGRQRGIPNRLLSMLFQAEPTFKPIDASATLFRGKALELLKMTNFCLCDSIYRNYI